MIILIIIVLIIIIIIIIINMQQEEACNSLGGKRTLLNSTQTHFAIPPACAMGLGFV